MEEKQESKAKKFFKKLNTATKAKILIPYETTQQAAQAVKVLTMMRNMAGEYVHVMDGFLDPSDLKQSIVKIELGLAYLKRSDAEDRVELIDDIIRELKSCKTIAKRIDDRCEEKEENE